MDFPLTGLMDEGACYARLVEALHPDGLACPRCGATGWASIAATATRSLAGYVAIFEWANNLKRATDEFLASLLGSPYPTNLGS